VNELALFAGAGGGILGGKLLGWRTVCAVERDGYAAQVLAQRQNDGFLEPFPIWSDVCTFDGKPWVGRVDVISGGFPCQDISGAGKGAGINGARSGLWRQMGRIIGEVRPSHVFVENSAVLTSRGLGVVLGDLAAMGFDARWGVLGAGHVGAPHVRERIWILANSHNCRQERWLSPVQMGWLALKGEAAEDGDGARAEWPTKPGVGILADGVAARMEQLNALGNGQVPRVAAAAWRMLGGPVA